MAKGPKFFDIAFLKLQVVLNNKKKRKKENVSPTNKDIFCKTTLVKSTKITGGNKNPKSREMQAKMQKRCYSQLNN